MLRFHHHIQYVLYNLIMNIKLMHGVFFIFQLKYQKDNDVNEYRKLLL